VSDALTIGGAFYYGDGDDEDIQYTNIGNGFGGWDPVADVGTSLSNEQIKFFNPFNVGSIKGYEGAEITFASAGSVGGRLYTSYKPSKDLTLGGTLGYFQSEEDEILDVEAITFAAGLHYKIMENTSWQMQLEYLDGTFSKTNHTAVNGDIDFDSFRAGSGLFVKF
jgi:hypothetical protein